VFHSANRQYSGGKNGKLIEVTQSQNGHSIFAKNRAAIGSDFAKVPSPPLLPIKKKKKIKNKKQKQKKTFFLLFDIHIQTNIKLIYKFSI